MTTISFSIEDQIKDDIERIAQEEHRSRNDVFREMYDIYKFKKTLASVRKVGLEKFLTLGIESIDQAEAYLG